MGKRNDRNFKKITKALTNISMADLAFDLEKDLNTGMASDELRKKYQAKLTARSIMIALSSEDEGAATANLKDLTDRNEGRSSEKSKLPNPLEKLTDAQLEALLRTEISDLKASEKTTSSELH
jgi:hypothetical protein